MTMKIGVLLHSAIAILQATSKIGSVLLDSSCICAERRSVGNRRGSSPLVYLLLSMGIEVKLPIVIRVDNIGAIFMSNNVTVSPRTKHVDVRYHFVREFVYDGFIKIIFVRSEENDADLFNKNLPSSLHNKHSRKMLIPKGKLNWNN